MYPTKKQLLVLLKSPGVIMLLVSLLLLIVNILFIGKHRPFNSDDLYWQQVVRTWHPFGGRTLWLGTKDTFIEQVPFYYLMEHFFAPTRKLLVAETIMLTGAAFVAFYASSLYFLRKLRIRLSYTTLLPFVWLSSFGYPLVQNYLNSDWRTFELGFSFLTFVLVAAVCNDDLKPLHSNWSKIVSATTIAFIGILTYSDPYYLFFTLGPVLLFVTLLYYLKKITRAQVILIYSGFVLSLVFSKITALICAKAGFIIVTDTPAAFINFDSIVTNVVTSVHGLLILYGADFFGRPTTNKVTIGETVNAVLLVFVSYRAYKYRKIFTKASAQRLSIAELWVAFFAGTMFFVFLIYTSSTLVTLGNYRYFIMFLYCSIVLLAVVLHGLENYVLRISIVALLSVATIFNMGYTLVGHSVALQGDVQQNQSNEINFKFIDALKKDGVEKGYASYWQANVNTYLSGNKITFLPTLCTAEGKTVPFKWLIDDSLYDRQTHKSFYLIDPDIPQPPICSQDQIIAQFGKPQKTLKISDKLILIYSYDVGTKMN
jgi:hypothetical protein